MEGARGSCKECGAEFFVYGENCGPDESLCEECLIEMDECPGLQQVYMVSKPTTRETL